MIPTRQRVQVTIEQMGRGFRAVEGSKDEVLPKNPKLFAILVEGYLDDFDRMRRELSQHLRDLRRTNRASTGKTKGSLKARATRRVRIG